MSIDAKDQYRAAIGAEPTEIREELPEHPCLNGCRYSKDVGMWPQHQCSGKCQYDTRFNEG